MIEYCLGTFLWSFFFFALGYVLGYMQRQLTTIEEDVAHVDHSVEDIKKELDDA